jgi:hypothetical protein
VCVGECEITPDLDDDPELDGCPDPDTLTVSLTEIRGLLVPLTETVPVTETLADREPETLTVSLTETLAELLPVTETDRVFVPVTEPVIVRVPATLTDVDPDSLIDGVSLPL